jgi:hypothetical protein
MNVRVKEPLVPRVVEFASMIVHAPHVNTTIYYYYCADCQVLKLLLMILVLSLD